MPIGEQRVFWQTPAMRCILFKTKDGLEIRLVNDHSLVVRLSTAIDAADALRIADLWRAASTA